MVSSPEHLLGAFSFAWIVQTKNHSSMITTARSEIEQLTPMALSCLEIVFNHPPADALLFWAVMLYPYIEAVKHAMRMVK